MADSYLSTGPPAATPAAFHTSGLHIPMLPVPQQYNPLHLEDEGLQLWLFYCLRASLCIHEATVYSLLATVPPTLDDFLTCHIDKAMFCTHYRSTLLPPFGCSSTARLG